MGAAKDYEESKMRVFILFLGLLVLMMGCQILGPKNGKYLTCTLRIVNASKKDIIFVKLGDDEFKHDFGFYDAGGGAKTFFGTSISCSAQYSIRWEEGRVDRHAVVNLSKCIGDRGVSKLTLTYVGNGQWTCLGE
jgi:hypothetical protein